MYIIIILYSLSGDNIGMKKANEWKVGKNDAYWLHGENVYALWALSMQSAAVDWNVCTVCVTIARKIDDVKRGREQQPRR